LAVVGNAKGLFGIFKMKAMSNKVSSDGWDPMKKVYCLFKVIVGMVMAIENGWIEGDFLHEKGVSDGNGAPEDSKFDQVAPRASG
jgi:hypothetical protein